MTHTLEPLRSGALAGRRRVTLSGQLTAFPTELFRLADDLEILDLSGNQLSALPDDLPRLHKLRILFCSNNQFTELPAVLGQCPELRMLGFKANRITTVSAAALPPRLRWLTLTDNQISELPAEIGACTDLQKLMLAGNRLRALPASLSACQQLELVRVAANALTHFPQVLLTLPRLAWLAFAGNPFCADLEAAVLANSHATLPAIPWSSLTLQNLLGEGASGVIHRADLASDGPSHPVAVKLFKGAMTSDGLPHCELAACLAAGQQRHLIPLLGRIHAHPQGTDGLVMALVDQAFQNLALPPSLDSCTRDIYPPGRRFDLPATLRIATHIASAARHLHARGVLHGDLYGHNTLHNAHGDAMLGDFGAASLYAPDRGALGMQLQRVEVRAFGCLLEELLDRTDCPAPLAATVRPLRDLVTQCLDTAPEKRPFFDAIETILTSALGKSDSLPIC